MWLPLQGCGIPCHGSKQQSHNCQALHFKTLSARVQLLLAVADIVKLVEIEKINKLLNNQLSNEKKQKTLFTYIAELLPPDRVPNLIQRR